ncbi:MAG: intradiol ring-cleavage dioxygenase [Alphaproteobacteria bacterium]|nr:intradiol ring-cleavage dioxygenase [Alphaproteobacteria bacterium]
MNDSSIGRFSRRNLLLGGGAIVAAGVGAYALVRGLMSSTRSAIKPVSFSFDETGQCVLSATMTEGPYYVDEALVRRDVRDGRAGQEFLVRLKITDAKSCEATPGAVVDIWHCDADGNYSAAPPLGSEERTPAGHLKPNSGDRFLRGRQIANVDGIVEFVTIYPGWYRGRTPHIHFKIHVGEREVATSQLFFAKELSAEVYATPPYAARGLADTTNDDDGVLRSVGVADGVWPKVVRDGERLVGTLTVGVARATDLAALGR